MGKILCLITGVLKKVVNIHSKHCAPLSACKWAANWQRLLGSAEPSVYLEREVWFYLLMCKRSAWFNVSVREKISGRCLGTVGWSESWISQRWRVMFMTSLETQRGTITRLTTGGLWGTWSQPGLVSQTETGSSLIPCWLRPTQHHMHTGMRRQPRDTAPHVSRLDMNQRGQSSPCPYPPQTSTALLE